MKKIIDKVKSKDYIILNKEWKIHFKKIER